MNKCLKPTKQWGQLNSLFVALLITLSLSTFLSTGDGYRSLSEVGLEELLCLELDGNSVRKYFLVYIQLNVCPCGTIFLTVLPLKQCASRKQNSYSTEKLTKSIISSRSKLRMIPGLPVAVGTTFSEAFSAFRGQVVKSIQQSAVTTKRIKQKRRHWSSRST